MATTWWPGATSASSTSATCRLCRRSTRLCGPTTLSAQCPLSVCPEFLCLFALRVCALDSLECFSLADSRCLLSLCYLMSDVWATAYEFNDGVSFALDSRAKKLATFLEFHFCKCLATCDNDIDWRNAYWSRFFAGLTSRSTETKKQRSKLKPPPQGLSSPSPRHSCTNLLISVQFTRFLYCLLY